MSKPNLPRTLENLRLTLGFSHEEWADHLRFTPNGYQKYLLGKKQILLSTCMELAEKFHFSLESLSQGKLDFKAVLALRSGDTSYIHERYRKPPYSRFDTARSVFNFLELCYGFPVVAALGRKFQIHPVLFSKEEGWLNHLIFSDLNACLDQTLNLPDDFYYQMGRHSAIQNASMFFGQMHERFPKVKVLYEYLFEEYTPYYEKNAEYNLLKITSKSCLIRTRTRKEVAQELGVKTLGSPGICQLKAGFYSALPNYIHRTDVSTREVSCVHDGAPYCVFEISFEHLLKAKPHCPPSGL